MQELELSLQREMTQHQREMSSLQTVQNERINSLTQRHQHEVDQLQSRVDELERASGCVMAASPHSGEREGGGLSMKLKCSELEREVEKLTAKICEMEKSRLESGEADGAKWEQLEQLTSENSRLKQRNDQLQSQLRVEQVNLV